MPRPQSLPLGSLGLMASLSPIGLCLWYPRKRLRDSCFFLVLGKLSEMSGSRFPVVGIVFSAFLHAFEMDIQGPRWGYPCQWSRTTHPLVSTITNYEAKPLGHGCSWAGFGTFSPVVDDGWTLLPNALAQCARKKWKRPSSYTNTFSHSNSTHLGFHVT